MKAIYIKYLPATNTKPTRLKAHDGEGHSVTMSGSVEPHKVALALCEKMDWPQDLIGNRDVFLFATENRYTNAKYHKLAPNSVEPNF